MHDYRNPRHDRPDLDETPPRRRGGPRRADAGPYRRGDLRDLFASRGPGRPTLRRGDIRPLILAMLSERPMHGYQLMQELEARSGGRWRPSPGSIYPTLQLLEDEGLVRSEELDGRRTYTVTDAGKAAHATSPIGRHPLAERPDGPETLDLRRLALDLVGAAVQVRRVGSADAQRQARAVLVDSRRRMYRLLADDEDEEPTTNPIP